MLPRRRGLAAALLLVSLSAAACGSDDSDSGGEATAAPSSDAASTAADQPSIDLPETICTALTTDEMGGVLQAEVTVEAASDEQCTFTVVGRDISINVLDAYDATEGLGAIPDQLKKDYGPVEQVPELGAPAAVAVGKPKGDVISAGGVIRRGDYYVTGVALTAKGVSADVVRDGTAAILELISQQ